MVVLICGGRGFTDKLFLFSIMDRINKIKPISRVIEGEARGADKLGGEWAESRGIPVAKFPADWDKHGKQAGFIRNIDMLNRTPNLVVGFDPGRGTAHTLREAHKRGLKIFVFDKGRNITKTYFLK